MQISPKSLVLIAVQLAGITYLLISGPWLVGLRWVWLETVGLGLGAWAVWTFKLRNLHITPDPARDAQLVTHGPYRFIRHPMYAAVLLISLAWLLDRPTLARLIVWLVLAADLIAKLRYEEHLLQQRFSNYGEYQRKTKRLLPFVF